jgi:hypothetical protein
MAACREQFGKDPLHSRGGWRRWDCRLTGLHCCRFDRPDLEQSGLKAQRRAEGPELPPLKLLQPAGLWRISREAKRIGYGATIGRLTDATHQPVVDRSGGILVNAGGPRRC